MARIYHVKHIAETTNRGLSGGQTGQVNRAGLEPHDTSPSLSKIDDGQLFETPAAHYQKLL